MSCLLNDELGIKNRKNSNTNISKIFLRLILKIRRSLQSLTESREYLPTNYQLFCLSVFEDNQITHLTVDMIVPLFTGYRKSEGAYRFKSSYNVHQT